MEADFLDELPLARRSQSQRILHAAVTCAVVVGTAVFLLRDYLPALLFRVGAPAAPSHTAIPLPPLPVFSDWRVAYVGRGGRLRAITVDGKTDVSGIALPGLDTQPGLNIGRASASPNGRLIAYPSADGLTLGNLIAPPGSSDALVMLPRECSQSALVA